MEAVRNTPEQRVLLRNVSWETYERLLEEREERRVPRFYYDRGLLEIMSPSAEHEGVGGVIAALVGELILEMDDDLFDSGSTTFRRHGLERGFEPDESFYFAENAGRVRGKRDIDLDAGDPPPDLVVEVDITSLSLGKLPIYAAIGIREIWRVTDGSVEILRLRQDGYENVGGSEVLPPLDRQTLASFIERGLSMRRPEWIREVRGWAAREVRKA